MCNEKMQKRKDNKGRVLKDGESQRKDGRYVYQYNVLGKRKCIYSTDLNELRKKEKKINNDIEMGIFDSEVTLNYIFDNYICTRKVKENTLRAKKSPWDYRIRNSIGNQKVSSVKKAMLMNFYYSLADEGLKNSVIQIYNMVLNMTFEMAIELEIISKNPCKNCMKSFPKDTARKIALTREEQEEFLNYVKGDRNHSKFYELFFFMLSTGARCGESIGLTWNDVDFKKREISINHQLQPLKRDGKYRNCVITPKTKSGNRIIPMTRELSRVMKELLEKQMASGVRQATIDGYSNFCFIGEKGTPRLQSAVNRKLSEIVKKHNENLPQNIPLPHMQSHILRHTACTRMAENGVDVKVLQEIMGHSNIAVTMEVYNHVTSKRLHDEIKKMENVRIIG